jgi:hypothetical protein
MSEELPAALIARMAKILACVDFGENEPPAEYLDYAREVCNAVWAAGLQITPQDEVLSANEAGADVAWGTA